MVRSLFMPQHVADNMLRTCSRCYAIAIANDDFDARLRYAAKDVHYTTAR